MGAIGPSNNNLMQRTPATVSRAGSNLMPGNAATTSTRQRITPENYRQVLGAEADVLLSPHDLKNLYEKGYMDVQRQFQTAESNEGFLTLASKLGAALVGPSRSVGAIQIDPLFLEMIKDPNAQSGFGYTRVKSETLSIIAPTEYQEPTTPEVPRPIPPQPNVPILGTDPIEQQFREHIEEQQEEQEGVVINGLSPNRSWAGVEHGDYQASLYDSTVLGSVQEQYGLSGSGEDAQMANSVVGNFFTGDMGRYNSANRANNIIGNIADTRTWALKRMNTQHVTNNPNSTAGQYGGKAEYGFLTTEQLSYQKLEGPMLDDYNRMMGSEAKENPDMRDLYIATRQNMTLGAEPSQAEALVNEQAPEGQSSQMESNQQDIQNKFKALHQKAFPSGASPDGTPYDLDTIAKNASMEDLYALALLVETDVSPEQRNQALSIDNDGNIALTPESSEVFGPLLGIPPGSSGAEMVATYSMLMEANYQDDSGEMLLSTDADVADVRALHQSDFEAKGQGDRLAGLGPNADNTADVTNIDAKVGQMESSHLTDGAVSRPTTNEGDWDLTDQANSAVTVQGGQPLDLSQVSSSSEAGTSALAGIRTLREKVFAPGSLTEPIAHDSNYQRSAVNNASRSVRAAIDRMPADDPAKASLEQEFSRIMNVDSRSRGQFRQTFGGTTVTRGEPIVTQEPFYNYDDVVSSVTNDNSVIGSWVDQSEVDDNFVLRSESVDDYKTDLKGKIDVIDGLLASPEKGAEAPLTPEQIDTLKTLKAEAEAKLAILENPPEALQASIDKGDAIVSGRASALAEGNGDDPSIPGTSSSFQAIDTKIDELNTYMKQALANGSIDENEKEEIKGLLNNMAQSVVSNLEAKGVSVNSPLEALSMTRETLTETGQLNADEIDLTVRILDRLKTAQSTIGLVGEAPVVNNLYQGVRALTRKLDSFDEVQVAKKAFSGELKTLATEKPEVFDDFISAVYGIDKTEENAVQFDQIREAAKNETLPFPPNIEIVDRADINGANGAYINSETGDADDSGKILLSRDLLAEPERLNEVFKEEMFHHLEHLDQIQNASGKTGRSHEASGDEGRAAITIMKEIHNNNGNMSLDAMNEVGNAARSQSANVQSRGRIVMDDATSDAGTYDGQRIEFSSGNPEPSTATATTDTEASERPVNPISELAEVDMEIGSSNPYAQREVADVPTRDPGNTTEWGDNGFSEPTIPEGPVEEKGAFDMATLIKGFPDGLIAAGQMFTTLADKIEAIVARDFKGGVAKNLANASSLMKTATEAIYGEGGYHGNDRDAVVGRDGGYEMGRINLSRRPNSNWSADPSYANQSKEDANKSTYQQRAAYDKERDDAHKQRVQADNARNA